MNTEQRNALSQSRTLVMSLLGEQDIPVLNEHEYQEVTRYLFANADSALRLQVAEAVFFQGRNHPQALGLFLACACPLAQRVARKFIEKTFPQPPDLTEELLYHGAVNGAIRMFQRDRVPGGIPFRSTLYCALKTGAMQAAFHRTENKGICCIGSVDHHANRTRVEDQFIAKEMLEKIAALEPEHETARIYRFLRCLVTLGPHVVLRPLARDPRRRSLMIDLKPIMQELGISCWAARQYLSQAREMLRQKFNADGLLFVKSTPVSR